MQFFHIISHAPRLCKFWAGAGHPKAAFYARLRVWRPPNGNVDLILGAIFEDSKITQKNIAIKTGLSTCAVSREIKQFRDKSHGSRKEA
jgi:hypothetical protein